MSEAEIAGVLPTEGLGWVTVVPIDPPFERYLPEALARLGYLFPKISFSRVAGGVSASGLPPGDIDRFRRDVLYTVYREKIYAKTLAMRISFLEAVTRK